MTGINKYNIVVVNKWRRYELANIIIISGPN